MNELNITSSQGFRVKLTPMHSCAPLPEIVVQIDEKRCNSVRLLTIGRSR
ncbi:hypothetical protein H1Q63_20990 [Desmonostoc muscorum CCALA 125]|nr:hypothetical protein [Desmonostoc muscorum CCALA 125]